jgi:hypothetical protein
VSFDKVAEILFGQRDHRRDAEDNIISPESVLVAQDDGRKKKMIEAWLQ